MLTNYFKVALRFMFRNKAYSAINVFGLAFGITGAMLLFLWIEREFSYDQFHTGKENIYKAWNRTTSQGQISCWDITPRVLAPALKTEYASVETAISFARYTDSYLFSAGEIRIMKNVVWFTDPEFLTMFSFPLVKGETSTALGNPNTIVLTESFARKLFGEKEALGETLTIGYSGYNFPLTVTGVLKDLPSNTDLQFEFLIPWQFLESLGENDTQWGNNSVSTFVKVKEGTDIQNLNKEIRDIRKKHASADDQSEVFLYPLSKMHLYSRFENGLPAGGRIEIIRMLGILGVCLIVVACINFINLSTARAQRRTKEVAVRKVTGAIRQSLIIQFLCESILIALGAGIISLAAVYLVLPSFNSLVQQQLTLHFENATFWVGSVALIIFVGILAGSYPAIYLSSFRPARILKGTGSTVASRKPLRNLLVILQFGFAMVMIVSTIVIYEQIRFVQNRDAGYVKENLVYHFITGDLGKNYSALKNELIQSRIAMSVTRTSSPVTERMSSSFAMQWNGKDPQDKTVIERFHVDEDFVATAGLTILEGRDMDLQRFPSDSSAALLNETAVKLMGFKHPIGETIVDDGKEWHVIGVIKDFILTSPQQKVGPMVLKGGSDWSNVIHIRLNAANPIRENIAELSRIFKKYNTDYPVEFHFVDAEFERKFAGLEKTRIITTVFSAIAIFIACLGLLGLSTYMIEVRTKEIGIRKVMGGSVANITGLLGYASIKPILIAIVLFSPMAWLSMNWWLQSFAYRISLDGLLFLKAAFSILLIAAITIGIQTIRAANLNPVKTLRNE